MAETRRGWAVPVWFSSRRGARGLCALVLSGLVCVVVSCSFSPGEEPPEGEEKDDPFVPRTWVRKTAEIYVLGEMVERNWEGVAVLGSEEYPYREGAGGSFWVTNIDYFLESGLFSESGDGYVVNTDMSTTEAGRDMYGGAAMVGQVISDTLWSSDDVDWCGDPISGQNFADEYFDEFYGDFSSEEEYIASIADYVDCGSGNA